MNRLSQTFIRPSFALLLLFQPVFTHALASEVKAEESQPLNAAPHNNAPQPGELNITLHPLDHATRAENDYRKAVQLVQHGQNISAERLLQRALSLQVDHLLARELLTTLLVKRNAVQDAIAVLAKGIDIAPGQARFPLWLAQLHMKLDAAKQALNVLEKNAARFQHQPTYLGVLATLYQQSGRHTEAHQNFLRATNLAPQDGRWWLGLGMTEEALENWASAKDAYRRAKEYGFIEGPLLQFVQQRLAVMSTRLQQQKS